MKAFQFNISGNWAHFRKTETNNNPLSHDFITKTALVGLIGAVLGVERQDMKGLFPILCEDLIYGVQIKNTVQKQSWGFTLRSINDALAKSPRQMEFIREPQYEVVLCLKNIRSEGIYDQFLESVAKSEACYTPVLGLHNCAAELSLTHYGKVNHFPVGDFQTTGFVSTKHKPILDSFPKLGFDRIPTYQNEDFWNIPEKYVPVVYPCEGNMLSVNGEYYIFNDSTQWFLI